MATLQAHEQHDRRAAIFSAVLAFLCLIPTLAFPISPDHAIFFFGGRTLLDGGMLYRDFVDIKPPVVYYLFAAVQSLFGSAELSLRLFDLLWQSCTLISLYSVLMRCSAGRTIALTAPVVYALGYTASNFTSTFQCETLAALPLIWMLYLYIRHPHSLWAWPAIGVLYGFILHLKYTFGVVVLPLVIADIAIRRPALLKATGRYLLLAAGFAVSTAAVYLPVVLSGAWQDYLTVVEFVRTYASLQSPDDGWLVFTARSLALYFADKFSLVYTAGAVVGIVVFMRQRRELPADSRLLFTLLLWQIVFLLLSVVVERKFLPYHFSRMFIAAAPFIAAGLVEVWRWILSQWREAPAGKRITIGLLCAVALAATPLPRFARVYYGLGLALAGNTNSQYTKSDPAESILIRGDQQEAVRYVQQHASTGESTLVVSVHAAPVYFFLQPLQAPMLPSSQFYIAEWCAPAWKKAFAVQLASAGWLIVQTNDRHPDITGVDATGLEFIQTQHGSTLEKRYFLEKTFGKFAVYRARPAQRP